MAALCEVKQHLAVHLAAHINDSSVFVCLRVCRATGPRRRSLVRVKRFSRSHAHRSHPRPPACERPCSLSWGGGSEAKRQACLCAATARSCLFRREVDEVNCESVSAPFEM